MSENLMKSSYANYKHDQVIRFIDSIKNGWRVFPPSLQIGVTDICYNRCPMCGHWKRKDKKSLDLEQLLWFLNLGKSMGLETVGYSGGDPLALKSINQIMEWHVKNDVVLGIVTSGYVPQHVNMELLKEAAWVRVSLDAITPQVYKDVRDGIDISMVRDSIENMLRNGIKVGIGITVHRDNIDDVPFVLEYAKMMGIKQVRLWPVRAHSLMDPIGIDKLNKLLFELDSYWAPSFKGNGIDNNISTFTEAVSQSQFRRLKFVRCYVCLYQLFIGADGGIYHCCTTAGDTQQAARLMPLGYIHQFTYESEWRQFWFTTIMNFHLTPFDHLPEVCREECILRHYIANQIAYENWELKNFQ